MRWRSLLACFRVMEMVEAPPRDTTFYSLGFHSPIANSPLPTSITRFPLYPYSYHYERHSFPSFLVTHSPLVTQVDLPNQLFLCKAKSADSSEYTSVAPPPPVAEFVVPTSPDGPRSKDLKEKVIKSEQGLEGPLSEKVPYLMGIGLDLDQIKGMARRHPPFARYSLERRIKPIVEFLLGFGVAHTDVPFILYRRPSLCGFSIKENLIPKKEYLEGLGVDRKHWAKVIRRNPVLLTCSNQTMKAAVDYLTELGISRENIGNILMKYPGIICCNVDAKLKPSEEYFGTLGIDVANLMCRFPQIFGLSINKNLIPKMKFLEDLGVDKARWAEMIRRCPSLLTLSKEKIKATVDYLTELGISNGNIGKVITKFPDIVGYNVDTKLRPTELYFRSLGVDAAVVMYRNPVVFGLSLEANVKPTSKFFLDKGFTTEEIRIMVSRLPKLYVLNTEKNLTLKWEFFMTMDYPKSELVKYPSFFFYSLKKRIKPRYDLLRKCGVRLELGRWLIPSDDEFARMLEKKNKENNGDWCLTLLGNVSLPASLYILESLSSGHGEINEPLQCYTMNVR